MVISNGVLFLNEVVSTGSARMLGLVLISRIIHGLPALDVFLRGHSKTTWT